MKLERWAQIETLYHAALEREPAARAAFLAAACAGDEPLRHQVTALLAQDDSNFINTPALNLAARALAVEAADLDEASTRRIAPPQLGAYQLLALLGRGGMGEVHLALDTRLKRKVAVKLLPAEFTTDAELVRRFAQEARAASALNHPNIITIHEIGESENTHYLVTEYVEGETLRQRLATEPKLKLTEVLSLATQITEALAAAHAAGITHRDIKPENVMVRRDGYVKVLDFGLAKLTEHSGAASENDTAESSTAAGIVMGTPRYMSPEQARGEKVDARTDIFSFGVMLYELIAGVPPFAGATTGETIAAILRDEPTPLTAHAPDTPPALQRIVSQALCKERAERFQSINELQLALQDLRHELDFAAEAQRRAEGAPPVATTNPGNEAAQTASVGALPARWRIFAGKRWVWLACVALLVVACGAAFFYFKRAPVLIEKDTILLADFENQTGEPIFDATLKQGLALHLQQSPFLNLLPDGQVQEELKLVKRPANERVTAELAREICIRKNLKAFIAGSIAAFGSHYVISLSAVNGQTSEVMARTQVEAAGKEQVLSALAQAATDLRGKLGESLSSLQLTSRAEEAATTANLEAFQFYMEGIKQTQAGKLDEAIPPLRRAVERDPEMAMAWSMLGAMYGDTDQPERAAECVRRAYALRERVSEREKLRITYWYHCYVSGDLPQQIETLRLQQRMFPGNMDRGNIDLGQAHYDLGQSAQAAEHYRESIRYLPTFPSPRLRLALSLLRLNRFNEAGAALQAAGRLNAEMPALHGIQYQLAFIKGDAEGQRREIAWARGKPVEYLAWDWQTGAAAYAGQWRQAQQFARRALELTAHGETQEIAARYATEQALRSAVFADCRQAKLAAAQGLKLSRGRASLSRATLALALCGEQTQARALSEELGKRYPEDTLVNGVWLPLSRAALALQRGQAALALEQLQATTRYEAAAEFWPQYLRAQAHLRLQQNADAAAAFQQLLDHRGHAPLSVLYPLAQLGLARASALTGATVQSREAYENFFLSWQKADADLPLLHAARQEYELAVKH